MKTGPTCAGRLISPHTMRRFILPLLLATSVLAQTADPKPLVEKAVNAVGGKDKLLKIFRIKEIFHFGSTPEPAEGKKRSPRESILSQPDKWRIKNKERGTEPAKDDARAWSPDLLVDEKSKFEIIPDLADRPTARSPRCRSIRSARAGRRAWVGSRGSSRLRCAAFDRPRR